MKETFLLTIILAAVSCIAGQVTLFTKPSFTRNANQFGGSPFSTNDFNGCFNECANRPTCMAVDFVTVSNACFLHDQTTGCTPTSPLTGANNYQLRDCNSPLKDKDWTVTPDKSSRPPPGAVLQMGDILEQGGDFEACLQFCMNNASCVGVDYNPVKRQCMVAWTISETCSPQNSPGWIQYSFALCIELDLALPDEKPACTPTKGAGVDLVLILDKSPSICSGPSDALSVICPNCNEFTCNTWNKTLDFLINLVTGLDMGPNDNQFQVALITFSDNAIVETKLWESKTSLLVRLQAIKDGGILSSNTNAYSALYLAEQQVLTQAGGDRKTPKNVVLIITDGSPNINAGDELVVAARLVAGGTTLIAVGPGSHADPNYLELLVDPVTKKNAIEGSTYFVDPDLTALTASINNNIQGGVNCPVIPVVACERAQLDIVFIIDSSGSVCNNEPTICENWLAIIQFVRTIIQKMTIGPTFTQVGVVLFSRTSQIMWYLNTHTNQATLLSAVDGLMKQYFGGPTNVAEAFIKARTNMFGDKSRGDRTSAHNVIIFISDGEPNLPQPATVAKDLALQEAQLARDRNIMVYSVGIRSRGVTQESKAWLKDMSGGDQNEGEDWFTALQHDELLPILTAIINRACAEPIIQKDSCELVNLDLTFILDTSSSVCNFVSGTTCQDWEDLIDFIDNIVGNKDFYIGRSANQVAVIIFSSTAEIMWTLDRYTTKATLRAAIQGLKSAYTGGTTNMYEAFNLLIGGHGIYGGQADRKQALNYVIMVTDGKPTENTGQTTSAAERVKAADINIVMVGVGPAADEDTLATLSSPPSKKDENYFSVTSYQKLDIRLQDIIKSVCDRPPTPPPPKPGCNVPFEVIFLVDSSGSVCGNQNTGICPTWESIITFMKDITRNLNIGNTAANSRVALVLFSNIAEVKFRLWDFNTSTSAVQAIDKIEYVGGLTNTPSGIRTVIDSILPDARTDKQKLVFVITDGEPNVDRNKLNDTLDELRAKPDVSVIAVRPNREINEEVLKSYSSKPQQVNKNYFLDLSPDAVNKMLSDLEKEICKASSESPMRTPGPTTTPTPRTPPSAACIGLDITFLIDGSGSICDNDPAFDSNKFTCPTWEGVLQFVKDVVVSLDYGPHADLVAVTLFSNEAIPKWGLLDGKTTKNAVYDGIDEIEREYPQGTTNLYDGLRSVRTIYENDPRHNAENVVIVLSDGAPDNDIEHLIDDEVKQLQKLARVYGVGFGVKVSNDTLKDVSSGSPPRENVDYFVKLNTFGLIEALSTHKQLKGCFGGAKPTTKRVTVPTPTPSPRTTRRTPPPTPPPTPAPTPGCNVDLAFVIDGSGSICDDTPGFVYANLAQGCNNWRNITNFVYKIVERLDIGPYATQVAVVFFANEGKTKFNFYGQENEDTSSLLNGIRKLEREYPGGKTNTYDGLNKLRTEVFDPFTGDRKDFPNYAIVITDGIPTVEEEKTAPEANRVMSEDRATIMTLGITKHAAVKNLQEISSFPQQRDKNWFVAYNFQDLESIRQKMFDQLFPGC